MKCLLLFCLSAGLTMQLYAQRPELQYKERFRPQVHFSPQAHWMNDPNGMVYHNGTYHLFFQYYPDGTVWGPMHWGHAVSKDLMHWKELPIALYPDTLGYIFSGSAVFDDHNTSGFGKNEKGPLVAIFTHHNNVGEKSGSITYQNQSIAYSNDDGKTWTKYIGNPVIRNTGIKDFRDPKVMWFEGSRKWVMTLATKNKVTFFSSPNLKDWTLESNFGEGMGAHGGVWECPDLFPLKLNDKTYWVLTVSVNPGGPNLGSATQYFIGQFDGTKFTALNQNTQWLDYGPDNYAGVTWSNTGERKILLGWMSNWLYARTVPTVKWRSAMTIPRELSLQQVGNQIFLGSNPIQELKILKKKERSYADIQLNYKSKSTYDISRVIAPFVLRMTSKEIEDHSITFANQNGEKVIVGYDKVKNSFFIDRKKSGITNFYEAFGRVNFVPRYETKKEYDLQLVVDAASIELFADSGKSVLTSVFFPKKPFSTIRISAKSKFTIKNLKITELKSIWDK